MATVYEIKIVSDWINYDEETLKKLLQEKLDTEKINIRVIEVERK